ncbi:hypothetical protein Pa4123_42620 [Phytohabitans aurantiacus]|uniref:Uncharacterized protein n=1 Tax=Phytohabitans aurantiacus TaxID=3016789 RepID=A0ABQ5QXJ5_9ACTN|nr:hypothetical protein Pa4123_42620 [Phytohabitans aurantiacus]
MAGLGLVGVGVGIKGGRGARPPLHKVKVIVVKAATGHDGVSWFEAKVGMRRRETMATITRPPFTRSEDK